MAPRALARRRDNRRPRFSPLFLLLLLLSLTMIGSQSGTGWGVAHAQAGGSTFKVALWNIQSGHGEHPLPGRTCGFTENGNCTDASLPLNGWGMHMVQDELVQKIRNDPAVIALGLAEAWSCATPAAVQQVLGWAARSTAKGGVALLAKYGFAGDVLGPLVYFAASGAHRLRIQAKEDGLGIDQIVLSAVAYRFNAPGALLNDTTIVPLPQAP